MKLRSELVLRQLGDEYVIVDSCKGVMDLSKVYTLNETAAFLWKELHVRDFDYSDIVELLLERYDVEKEQAESDAKDLMRKFKKINNVED